MGAISKVRPDIDQELLEAFAAMEDVFQIGTMEVSLMSEIEKGFLLGNTAEILLLCKFFCQL